MLTTIILASCISVQGELVAHLPSGEAIVRDGAKLYRGRPVRTQGFGATTPAAA